MNLAPKFHDQVKLIYDHIPVGQGCKNDIFYQETKS